MTPDALPPFLRPQSAPPAPPPIDPDIALALKAIAEREQSLSSLQNFARTYVGVEPALHHRIICDAVDDLMFNDRFDVLVVMSPPASAKSTYISVAAPAYIVAREPTTRIISVSRAAELAAEFGGRVKNIVESDALRLASPVAIAADTRAKDNWKTTAGGGYFAIGASGGVLGKRADVVICLPASTPVRTKNGYTSISDIKVGDEVEAYDREKLSTGYYRVTDTGWRYEDDIYRIHTADGRVVEATGNHPFFVDGNFVPAMALVVGDVLLSSVWFPGADQCDGDGQAGTSGKNGVLLRSQLRDDIHECHEGVQNPSDVQRVWEAVHEQGTRSARLAGLLGGVSAGGPSQGEHEAAQEHSGNPLFSLRHTVHGEVEDQHLLLDGVQEQGTRQEDVTVRESGVSPRQGACQVSERGSVVVQGCQEVRDVSGQSGVRDLFQHGEFAGTPCGHEQVQPRADQHRNVVSVLSSGAAWCRPGETFATTVARIERLCRNERVFDIKVEKVANFFANGILVHNCDDIHASFEDAQSESQLSKLRNWFEGDLLSRLTPTGKLIVIGQRLNPNDIIGFVMQRAERNPRIRIRVLKFSAEAPLVPDPLWPDPLNRAPGERMWPEFYTDDYLHDKKQDDFIWRTLWMQEPPSDTGSWVSTDNIRHRPTPPAALDPATPRYGMTDLALSVNTGDYTVHIVVAVDQNGDWDIVDASRKRVDSDQSATDVINFAQMYRPREWLIDDDNASKVFSHLVATRARSSSVPLPWRPMPMRGQDKETRAAALRGQFKRGKVWYPADAPFAGWLTREILTFPNATGSGVDDGIDALGLLGRRLAFISPAVPVVAPTVKKGYSLDDLWECQPAKSRRI